MVVNLDKREFVCPHDLGTGLKLWEQLANFPGTPQALVILCAAMPEPRGGGDFDLEENWHGPERTFPEHNTTPGPMPEDYAAVAKRTIGRWAGDRIALVGDYAEDSDLPARFHAAGIYRRCWQEDDGPNKPKNAYTDISADVARVIEHELDGAYVGDGWRHWQEHHPSSVTLRLQDYGRLHELIQQLADVGKAAAEAHHCDGCMGDSRRVSWHNPACIYQQAIDLLPALRRVAPESAAS